jgi:hypothetical protein
VTITVSRHALPAHLRHGDVLGRCTAAKIKNTKAKDKAASKGKAKGKSGSHGKKP